MSAQVSEPTAVAKVVAIKAFEETTSAATALPALNPYHPTQSIPVPTMQRTMLCGGIGSLLNPIRGPRIRHKIRALQPEVMWTTVPPAKSIALIPALEFQMPFMNPETPQ